MEENALLESFDKKNRSEEEAPRAVLQTNLKLRYT